MKLILTLLFVFLYLSSVFNFTKSEEKKHCGESRCSDHGPAVRFPFSLSGHQPDTCGYPGFHLSCDTNHQTILNLPNSVKLVVDNIDYRFQQIKVHEPNNCFANQIHKLDFSASVFENKYYLIDYSLFNCSAFIAMRGGGVILIPCMSGASHNAIAVVSDIPIGSAELLSCTKMYNVLSLPYDVFEPNITWSWSRPDCAKCESKGHKCGTTSIGSRTRVQCFDAQTLRPLGDGSTRNAVVIAGVVVSIFVVLLLAILAASMYRKPMYCLILSRYLQNSMSS